MTSSVVSRWGGAADGAGFTIVRSLPTVTVRVCVVAGRVAVVTWGVAVVSGGAPGTRP